MKPAAAQLRIPIVQDNATRQTSLAHAAGG